MIPPLIEFGPPTPWPALPPGIHDASIDEIRVRFATTPHRILLFGGFLRVVDALTLARCSQIYLDGSFVTAKPHPDDYDGCWDHVGMDFARLDPVLLQFENKREAQKKKFLGEMFPAMTENTPGATFLDFFQVEKYSGRSKGIIRVTLASPTGATA